MIVLVNIRLAIARASAASMCVSPVATNGKDRRKARNPAENPTKARRLACTLWNRHEAHRLVRRPSIQEDYEDVCGGEAGGHGHLVLTFRRRGIDDYRYARLWAF